MILENICQSENVSQVMSNKEKVNRECFVPVSFNI